MSLLEQLRQRREEILAIGARHGVSHVRVFGSVARGEEAVDSDIDLLVELAPESGYFELIGFALDVEDLLGRTVDALTVNSLHRLIRRETVASAIEL